VLRTLAILSALGFLSLVMLQAMAFYEPPKPVLKTQRYDIGYPTKAAPVFYPGVPTTRTAPAARTFDLGVGTKSAPVVPPQPLFEIEEPEDRMYFQATKAGVLGRLKRTPPAPAPAPHPRAAPPPRNQDFP
jgi:hypothetical protein